MAIPAADEAEQLDRSTCWCCGAMEVSGRLVHLGNHPEVALCLRCAHWAAQRAWEIEDANRVGPLVWARERVRAGRRTVMDHGWQHHRVFGAPLRWLGKRLP